MSPNDTCPACHLTHAIVPHCPTSPTCPWIKCQSCLIVLDPQTGQGWDDKHKHIVITKG